MRRIMVVCSVLMMATVSSLVVAQATEPTILTKHRVNVRDWTVRLEIRMRPERIRRAVRSPLFIPRTGFIEFKGARFVMPVLAKSSMHETYLDRLKSEVTLSGRKVTTGTLSESASYPDERVAELVTGEIETQDAITFIVEYPMTCYETRIDERRAAKIEWPKEAWPEDARPYLSPQRFIESESLEIRRTLRNYSKCTEQHRKLMQQQRQQILVRHPANHFL